MTLWPGYVRSINLATGAGGNSGLRCKGGQPCARAGFWRAPARAASRQHFELRQVMPGIGSAWGATIWQLDEQP